MMPILVLWIIFLFWGARALFTLGDEAVENHFNADIKENYNKIKLDLSQDLEIKDKIQNDKVFQKKAIALVGDQLKEISSEHLSPQEYKYNYPPSSIYFSATGIEHEYFTWLYCSKKGLISYDCGGYGNWDPDFAFYYDKNESEDEMGEYIVRYINIMKLVEKNIQEHYPEQRLVYIRDGHDLPRGRKSGHLRWEASLYREDFRDKDKVFTIW